MKKLTTFLLMLFFTANLFCQETYSLSPVFFGSEQQEAPVITPWHKGDFFVGVNSDVLGISILSLGLSPFIGYAISDNDMVYGSLYYTEDPRISTFKVGWNKRVYHSAYIGIAGAMYGENTTWQKSVQLEFGVCKNIWSWLMVSPKIGFTESWDDSNADFYFTTAVSFAVKL